MNWIEFQFNFPSKDHTWWFLLTEIRWLLVGWLLYCLKITVTCTWILWPYLTNNLPNIFIYDESATDHILIWFSCARSIHPFHYGWLFISHFIFLVLNIISRIQCLYTKFASFLMLNYKIISNCVRSI